MAYSFGLVFDQIPNHTPPQSGKSGFDPGLLCNPQNGGFHGGCVFQRGNLVQGEKLVLAAVSGGKVVGVPAAKVESMIGLLARASRAANRALSFWGLRCSRARHVEASASPEMWGVASGVGAHVP